MNSSTRRPTTLPIPTETGPPPVKTEPGQTGAPRENEFSSVVATFVTTLSIFGIYLVQGIIVARILGPLGRGEFGTALYFPRDVLLYAGLLGGIEIVNSHAVQRNIDTRSLKLSAAKVGLISGLITAVFAAALTTVVLTIVGKSYLVPFGLLCCLFVPWEHMQLTISAVDRGNRNFGFYNFNRLLFALSFPTLVIIAYGLNLFSDETRSLLTICILFLTSRIIGILPTLRGMRAGEALINGWQQRRPAREPHPPGQAVADFTEGANAEVPGPVSLLIQGRFYAISMLASELFERLDVFLIVALATVTESGFYFVAVPAAAMLTVAPNALAVFTFNAGADQNRKISLRQAVATMSATAAMQLISAAVFALIVPYLIIVFYKADYAAAIPFAMWLLPASAIKGYLQAADGYLKGRAKPMVGVRARLLSILLMLGFVWGVYQNLIPGPEQKLLCIPMAACLGQALSMVIISAAVFYDVRDQQSPSRKPDTREDSP